jgi:lipopolysaccharide export LptBFGC system permease protein LptF
MIKVLAIGRSLPRAMTTNCMLLQLLPYSNQQLISILSQKHNYEIEKNSKTRNKSNKTDNNKRNSSLVKSDFKGLCEQALPQFTITTRRVDEIWTKMLELFVRRVQSKHVAKSSTGSANATNNVDKSSTGSSNATNNVDKSSSSSTSSRSNMTTSSGTKRSLDEEVKSLVLLPAVHMPAVLSSGSSTIPQALPIEMESCMTAHCILSSFLVIIL